MNMLSCRYSRVVLCYFERARRSSPGRRPTFFAGAKKVGKESTSQPIWLLPNLAAAPLGNATTRLTARTAPPGCTANTPPGCCPHVSAGSRPCHAETCGQHLRWVFPSASRGHCSSREASRAQPRWCCGGYCVIARSNGFSGAFFCLLFFAPAKKRRSPAGRTPAGSLEVKENITRIAPHIRTRTATPPPPPQTSAATAPAPATPCSAPSR